VVASQQRALPRFPDCLADYMVIQEKSCLKVVSYIIYRGVGLSLVIDGFFETAWTIRIDGGSG
jgi:hypothetical protein